MRSSYETISALETADSALQNKATRIRGYPRVDRSGAQV